MRYWCGYVSGARCRLFAYGPADATAIPKPHHFLPHLKLTVIRTHNLGQLSTKCAPSQKIYEFLVSKWCDVVHSGCVVFKIYVSH